MRKPPLQDVIVMHPDERTRAPHRGMDGVPGRDRVYDTYASEARPHTREPATTSRDTFSQMRPPSDLRRIKHPPIEQDGDDTGKGGWWVWIALGVGGAVVATAYVLTVLFAGASVLVHPKQDTIVANASFTAREDGKDGALTFKRMTIEQTVSREVKAEKEEQVEEWAQGKITIYNEFSDQAQRLIKKTRFESEDGKVYRIQESVEVPGKKRDGSPGTIEVLVIAEESGESYNRGPGTFSVPGFKGLAQEGKIYARSTADMTGGFNGVRRTIAESDRVTARESLEADLRATLLEKIVQSSDRPEGYGVFKEAIFFEFAPLPDTPAGPDNVNVNLSGKLHAIIFMNAEIARMVAERTIGGYNGAPIRISNIDEVAVRVRAPDDVATNIPPWQSEAFAVTVTGKTVFIWEFNPEMFATDIAGKPVTSLQSGGDTEIRRLHPGIDVIVPTIRPFWHKSFPEDTKNIKVTVKLDE